MTPSLPTPVDVRLMNTIALVLGVGFCLAALYAGASWALRHPVFSISRITVFGDVQHHNEVTLRANVTPRLQGNFFTMDLRKTRTAFESVPWVRQAVVRREFPNRLRVTLEEHHSAGFWGADSESRLLNSFGEVFEANPGDAESQDLPRLMGPDDQAAQVLSMYRSLNALITPMEANIEELELSGRGGWRMQLDTGAVVELGRGSIDQVRERTQRFLATLTQVISTYQRKGFDSMESADLRHNAGYAIKLRGVSTVSITAIVADKK